jgi:hypothetical protein
MRSLAAEYEAATGRTAELFTRSGAGAVERGVASVPSLDALEALDDHDDQGTAP